MDRRNFLGYADSRPQILWSGQSKIAVNFVVNLEEGAELSLADGDSANEPGHEVQSKIVDHPDLCRESSFEFGSRVGYWRVMQEFERRSVRATLNVCGRFAQRCPEILRDAVGRGHDLCGHGWLWKSPAGMDQASERDWMVATLNAIESACGARPLGWHCKSSATPRTVDLTRELGLLYSSDAYNDELPYSVRTQSGPLLIVPYQFDTNDMRFFGEAPAFVRAQDFSGYVIDSLARLKYEAQHYGRSSMITIGLHTRIIGRSARIQALTQILDYLADESVFWLATRSDIARRWQSAFPPGHSPGHEGA